MKRISLVVAGLFIFARMSYAKPNIFKVDSIGDVGKYCSLASPPFTDYVSYYDSTNGDLKFTIGDFSGYFRTWYVDTLGDVGKFTAIDTWEDSAKIKNMLISYYDVTNGNLKCAWSKGTGFYYYDTTFELSTVDSIGDVGLFTSLYIDTIHKAPYISYYDATNKDLKLAYFKDSVWNIQKVDTTGDVGKYNSIAGYSDTISISYYDATNGDLKIAGYNGTNWQIEKIDTTGDVGEYSSISMDYSYYTYSYCTSIYYYDATNGDLKEVYKDTNDWNINKIDTLGDVGAFVCKGSSYGIYYYDKTNGDLRSIWGIIDTNGDVGEYPAGASGLGYRVYYYDVTNGDLKKAEEGDAVEESSNLNPPSTTLRVNQNPFFRSTVISYNIGKNVAQDFSLAIYDIAGKLVKSFPITQLPNYPITSLTWDGTDNNAKDLKTGVYFVRLTTICHSERSEESNIIKETKKLVLIK